MEIYCGWLGQHIEDYAVRSYNRNRSGISGGGDPLNL